MAKRTMERNWEEQTITILGKVYNYKELSPQIKDSAGFLGFGTKLVDNLAGMKAYSQEEKLKKVDAVYESLLKGNWRVPGSGKESFKKKLASAVEKATPEELAMMKKFNFIQS